MYEDLVKRLRTHNGWALNKTLDEAADAIEELQDRIAASEATIKRQSNIIQVKDRDLQRAIDAKSQWIPVTESEPEQGKRYLVIRYNCVTKTPFIDILWHDAHDLWWNRLYKGKYNVTHWMPLPEPPKEGE